MNNYLIFILAVIIVGYVLETLLSLLNLRALDPKLPELFQDVFDKVKYKKSQEYIGVTTRFSLVHSTFSLIATIGFILLGGFNHIDVASRSMGYGSIGSGLIFMGLLLLLSGAVSLPFSIYSTFVIEERFGFNKTTPKIFILDILKSILLTPIIGGPLLAFIIWFFETTGSAAWLYCWGATVAYSVFLQFVAPVLLLPLFNKFTPLEEGELRDAITAYAGQERFKMKGIYTMDGSKRSTKVNAYFTGFGKFRRIVFYDTLMEKLSTEEIVGVLAHEMGHYKLKHIFKMMAASILQMGLTFYILSLFLGNQNLFAAFSMQHVSVYAGLVFFGFLYAPISAVLSLIFLKISRKHEYQADAYALDTTGNARHLVNGLKKLSLANLSNLTPHPWFVMFHYSHPPLLQRLQAMLSMEKIASSSPTSTTETCGSCGQCFLEGQLIWSDVSDKRLCEGCAMEEGGCGCADE
ncbi:MAG: M48 family metallopeptidase [Desulfobulbaceae bacterium]|nr:M48 family metallopeptidase [Desulfobulbaceae bacterium]